MFRGSEVVVKRMVPHTTSLLQKRHLLRLGNLRQKGRITVDVRRGVDANDLPCDSAGDLVGTGPRGSLTRARADRCGSIAWHVPSCAEALSTASASPAGSRPCNTHPLGGFGWGLSRSVRFEHALSAPCAMRTFRPRDAKSTHLRMHTRNRLACKAGVRSRRSAQGGLAGQSRTVVHGRALVPENPPTHPPRELLPA